MRAVSVRRNRQSRVKPSLQCGPSSFSHSTAGVPGTDEEGPEHPEVSGRKAAVIPWRSAHQSSICHFICLLAGLQLDGPLRMSSGDVGRAVMVPESLDISIGLRHEVRFTKAFSISLPGAAAKHAFGVHAALQNIAPAGPSIITAAGWKPVLGSSVLVPANMRIRISIRPTAGSPSGMGFAASAQSWPEV